MRFIYILILVLFINFNNYGQLTINEFLSSNVNGILDEDNSFADWIEVFNSGSSAVNLSNYALSDEKTVTNKWTFPDLTIPASGYVLVFASGKNRKDLPVVYQTLIDMGDDWRYIVPGSDLGTDWHNTGFDDSGWSIGKSGFGYADDDDSTILANVISVFIRKEFMISDISGIDKLILHIDYDDGFVAYINGQEIARANLGSYGEIISYDQTSDIDHEALMYQGNTPGYFEISNPGDILIEGNNVIAIQGHNVSSTSSDMTLIPFLTIGRTTGIEDISPYLTFPESGGLHTNFKIQVEGESLYLFNPGGSLIDSVGGIALSNDISYGRQPDGSSHFVFFADPTPNNSNTTHGVEGGFTGNVLFSSQGGKHLGGITLSLSAEHSGDSIFYTTDGSIPDRSSLLYTGPITIGNSTVINARAINYTSLPGAITTNTFVTFYNHDLPIICLSTDSYNLWDETYGIFAFGPNPGDYPYFDANFWQNWERPIHIEFYDAQGNKKIDQGAGIKVFGAWSRACDQKSVALYARSIYGKGSFEYKFFADKPIEKFESIVLRNSGNDNMGLQFHDCFLTGLTRNMDTDRQAFQPAAIYINGEYWGLLNIREKVNEHFIAENHNVDPENINLLELNQEVIHGSNSDYQEIISYLNINTSLSNSEGYQWMKEQIDINNFIQYQITQIYINNQDWPGNNIKYWNTISPDSKWRWILYDTDFGYGIWNTSDYQSNTLEFALQTNGPDWPNPPWSTLLLRRLVTNLNFRNNFINQYCDRLNVDFHPDQVISYLDSLESVYDTEMMFHFNRWSGSSGEWQDRIENRKTYGINRPAYARSHLQQEFSLGSELEISVNVSDENAGTVKINTVSPKSYPFTGIYFEDVPIQLQAIPKVGYKFVRWEGANATGNLTIQYNMTETANFTAVFEEADASDNLIVINEINYASSDDWDTKDWIELINNGLSTVDLEDWLLSDTGPDTGFYFSPGVIIPPGEHVVICRNLDDFSDFNPEVHNAIGELPFGLSSNGDMIRLYDNEGNIIDAVDYYPFYPWPETAVQTGSSIELIHPGLDNMDGANWQASPYGGTPGINNTGYLDIDLPVSEPLASDFECFPNPFRDFTTIQFTVNRENYYRLEIFDINGRLLDVLADDYLAPGTYYIDWLGNTAGADVEPGGVFTVRLTSENSIQTLKLLMIK